MFPKMNLFVSVFYSSSYYLSIHICISFVSIPLLISTSFTRPTLFHNKEKKTINLSSSTVNKLFLLLNFYYSLGDGELTSSFNFNQTSDGSCINIFFILIFNLKFPFSFRWKGTTFNLISFYLLTYVFKEIRRNEGFYFIFILIR